jgi:hypothetical protein
MSQLPRIIASVAQLLNVDPRADRKAFVTALDRELGLRDQADPNAAAQLRADEQLLDKAVKDGKITASSRPRWRNALREDHDGAKRVIAALAANPFVGAANVTDAKRVRANLDGSSRTAVVQEIAGETPGAGFEPTVTTLDGINAAIEADPNLHKAMWAAGLREGLKPPPERFRAVPDADLEWDPQPELVMHKDGTGSHWETPEVDPKWLTTQGPRREPRTGRRTK